MENFFNNILTVLTDKTISLSRRTVLIISFFIMVFLINDTFNFSFNYRTNQKISQLKELYKLLPNDSITKSKQYKNIHQIENEIINNKTVIFKIEKTCHELNSGKGLKSTQINTFYRILSGFSVFIFLLIIFLFIEKDKKELKNIIIGIIFLSIITNFILLLIPSFENRSLNHWLNIGISIFVLIILGIYGNRKK